MRKAALIAGFLALVACADGPRATLYGTDKAEVTVRLELATTPEARARGLMYRKQLDSNAGMLFVFPNSEVHQFWMKNTPLPLDMIFIGPDNIIVGIAENTKPFSTDPRGVPIPSKYVLEVNGGFAAQHHIKAGSRVDLHDVPGTSE